jgi:hypothetical protein
MASGSGAFSRVGNPEGFPPQANEDQKPLHQKVAENGYRDSGHVVKSSWDAAGKNLQSGPVSPKITGDFNIGIIKG